MLVAFACCAASVPVNAADGQESGEQSQVDKLGFLMGDWDCTGRVFAHGNISAHTTTAYAHGTKVVDGHWILFRYDEVRTAENPRPFHIDQYFGYDHDTKLFVSVALDIGGYFTETTPDSAGDSISFDETDEGKVIGHDTFAKKSQDEIMHTGRSQDKNGKWVETDEEICRLVR